MKRVAVLLVVLAVGFGAVQVYRLRTVPASDATEPAVAVMPTSAIAPAGGARGPGLGRRPPGSLQLATAATFDLSHVAPEPYAEALGNDAERIFSFVRDEIAFEPYTGLLRGPCGTLMALAGNSVDRAALLASLLAGTSQPIRFVRGTLPEDAARELVMSTWARREPSAPAPDDGPSAPVQEAQQTFDTSLRRDFALVWEHARTIDSGDPRATTDDVASLVNEARTHYWVQWSHNGAWIDLDPSFADATIGRTFAKEEATFDTLPDELAHTVTIRIRLEEYTGAAAATREILTYTARAADLSGKDVVLSHVPEHWQGPAGGLSGALTSGMTDTGRIKPVLTVGDQAITGAVFAQQVKRTGLGGLGALLGGAGSRDAVPIATAEWLDVELAAPDRHETVVRELYDLVGVAQRRGRMSLSADEVASRTSGAHAFDATQALYDVLFTTGALDPTHLAGVPTDAPAADEVVDVRALLRRLNIAFVTTSDAILARLGRSDRSLIRFYPDAPRFVIAEISAPDGAPRLQLDLRQDQVRRVVLGSHAEDGLAASVLRGVVNGTLERTLVEYATAGARAKGLVAHMSTSAVFQQAHAEHTPMLLLPRDRATLDDSLSAHALARLEEDAARGLVAVAPQRPVLIAGVPRFAWWRIDPRTGETTAVTDEGLHQATEYRIVQDNPNGQITVVVRSRTLAGITQSETTFNTNAGAMQYIGRLIARGATLVEGNFWLPPI